MGDELILDREDEVAIVRLNRPERRNALTSELIVGIAETMAQLEADTSVGAVVLTGSDPAFCAGLDLRELSGTAQNLKTDETGRPWARMTKPVIGAINGPAVTGGLELVLHCDFAIGSPKAAFADTHARVGVMPGWGLSVLLPQAVGLRRAKNMSFTSNYVMAEQALAWGLINQIVPPEELVATAVRLGKDVCSIDRTAIATLLTLYDDSSEDVIGPGLEREYALAREWRDQAFSSAAVGDRREAIRERGKSQIS